MKAEDAGILNRDSFDNGSARWYRFKSEAFTAVLRVELIEYLE